MEGPRIVKEILLDQVGVPFSTNDDGELDFTREGAHSVARIVHTGDATGRASVPHGALPAAAAPPSLKGCE